MTTLNTTKDIKKFMIESTNKLAKEIADVDNVKITFSTRMSRVFGYCINYSKQIRYNLLWCERNKHQPNVLYDLCIHEVCHLVHANHGKDFEQLCAKYGIVEKRGHINNKHKETLVKQYARFVAICPVCDFVHEKNKRTKLESSCSVCDTGNKFDKSRLLVYYRN